MFLQIAGTKETIKYNGKNLTIYKYYNQALRLFHWIPITKPTAEFVINVSDLTPRIVAELKSLEKASCDYVLRQAAGRIFENIDFRQYHLSIARKLKVRLDAVTMTIATTASSVNHTKIYSVSEAKRMESGRIVVTGTIASISTSYKIISKSEWICDNLNCKLQGSETYKPPLLLPPPNLDDTEGFKIKCFKCHSTAYAVTHTYHDARTIQIENIDKTIDDTVDRLEVILYDDASTHVLVGEAVDITGDIYVRRKLDSSNARGKKLVGILSATK